MATPTETLEIVAQANARIAAGETVYVRTHTQVIPLKGFPVLVAANREAKVTNVRRPFFITSSQVEDIATQIGVTYSKPWEEFAETVTI